jgi:hypothetical protein
MGRPRIRVLRNKATRVLEQLRLRRAGIEIERIGSIVLFLTPDRIVVAHVGWDPRTLRGFRATSRVDRWRSARLARAA